MSDLPLSKKELRKQAMALRESLPMPEISRKIRESIEDWAVFRNAETVLLYHAVRHEVDLLPLTEKFTEKAWYLPRLKPGSGMGFYRYRHGQPLVLNEYGIPEPGPDGEPLANDASAALIFVPALMAAPNGHRLGYGKGYYDRFLSSLPENACPVIAVPHRLLSPSLPVDSWDEPARFVITEEGLYKP